MEGRSPSLPGTSVPDEGARPNSHATPPLGFTNPCITPFHRAAAEAAEEFKFKDSRWPRPTSNRSCSDERWLSWRRSQSW